MIWVSHPFRGLKADLREFGPNLLGEGESPETAFWAHLLNNFADLITDPTSLIYYLEFFYGSLARNASVGTFVNQKATSWKAC